MLVELETIVVGPAGGGEVETLATQFDVVAPSYDARHFATGSAFDIIVRTISSTGVNSLSPTPFGPPPPLPVQEKQPALPWLHSKATAFLFAANKAESRYGSVRWLDLSISLCTRRWDWIERSKGGDDAKLCLPSHLNLGK